MRKKPPAARIQGRQTAALQEKTKARPPENKRRGADFAMEPKAAWDAATLLSPVPAVLVGCCRANGDAPNLITVAWAGTINSHPPMVSISIRPERHSHGLIMETRAFTINMPSTRHARGLDYCGVKSGRDIDKWKEAGFTPEPSSKIRPPIVAECPLALECEVRHTLLLGTHTLFLAEVAAVRVAPCLIDAKGGLDMEKAGLIAFAHGRYYAISRELGHFGWSVKKK